MYIFISIFTQINKIILIKLLGEVFYWLFPVLIFSIKLPYPWICVVLVAFTYNSAIPSGYESCPMYTPLDITIIPQNMAVYLNRENWNSNAKIMNHK